MRARLSNYLTILSNTRKFGLKHKISTFENSVPENLWKILNKTKRDKIIY